MNSLIFGCWCVCVHANAKARKYLLSCKYVKIPRNKAFYCNLSLCVCVFICMSAYSLYNSQIIHSLTLTVCGWILITFLTRPTLIAAFDLPWFYFAVLLLLYFFFFLYLRLWVCFYSFTQAFFFCFGFQLV